MAAWYSGVAVPDLLALVGDLLAVANWQRQGKKNARRPKPIQRPGQPKQGTTYGADPIPVSSFDEWWDNPEEG